MGRKAEVAGLLAEVLAARAATAPHSVVVDGGGAAGFADSLAGALAAIGAPHIRLAGAASWPHGPLVVVADGADRRARPPAGGWGTVVFLRGPGSFDGEHGADVVVDHHDPDWPVIRRLDPALADYERWYLRESRAFFAAFHPSGRSALAARHGRTLRPDEPLAEARLGPLLSSAGWRLTCYDDPPDRFLATAVRAAPTPH